MRHLSLGEVVVSRSHGNDLTAYDISKYHITRPIFRIAGHPLAQNEKCLHMFLQDPVVDRSYVPGKVRNSH